MPCGGVAANPRPGRIHGSEPNAPTPARTKSRLFNFALTGRLNILADRYGRRGWVTPEVLNEVTHGIVSGYAELRAIESAIENRRLSVAGALKRAERQTYRELLRSLGSGEASCIAHAKSHGGTVVTDDRAARGCCAERAVPFTGTIGILKACCLDGTLPAEDADAALQSMIDAGYFSPVRRISDLL